MTDGETILWQRLDVPGHEIATITRRSHEWLVTGVAVFVEAGQPCRVEYRIHCDERWLTRRCVLRASIAARSVHRTIERNATGEWFNEGAEIAAIRGCDDMDLGFSPVTNLLPIRRLDLPIGAEATVRAAWVQFPEFSIGVLQQTYARVASDRYRYASTWPGGSYHSELTVDPFGCVIEYPGLWRAEATSTHAGETA